MENINDILLKYSGNEILVVLDNNKKVWFNAVQICNILKYTRPRDIIYKLVDKEFIKQLKNIIYDYKIYPLIKFFCFTKNFYEAPENKHVFIFLGVQMHNQIHYL